jgi:hypothetical protein
MLTDTQRRNQILKRINKMSSDKLEDLEKYVSKLEQETDKKSNSILYAGAWKDIEDSVFEDFTTNLINKRRNNRQRIDD